MVGIKRLFSKLDGQRDQPLTAPALEKMPTVTFDASRVTESVESLLKESISSLEDIESKHFEKVFQAALRSVAAGRDLRALSTELMDIDGMTKKRAGEIARSLNNKATVLMNRERREALGLTQATWAYSNAPCMVNPKKPSDSDLRQDAAHRAANGQQFDIREGLPVDGKLTWPGFEDGCKCSSRTVLPF